MIADGRYQLAADEAARSGTSARQRRVRRTIARTVVAVAAIAFFVCDSAPAFADAKLTVDTSTTYTINPGAGVVDAVQLSTFTNEVPNRTSGNYVEKTYFSGSNVIIPRSATNVVAQTDGVALTVERSELADSPAFQLLKIDFARDVYFQGSTTVEVRYSIEGAVPRDENDVTRVNPAFAGFWAVAVGDPDRTTLTIVVPESFEVDPISDLFSTDFETNNGNRAYTYRGAGQAAADGNTGWQQAWVAVSDPKNLESSPIAIGDVTFDVRGWTDDPEWTTFVSQSVTEGVPRLEELFGTPWPGKGTTEVRESITPYFYGYGGWYTPENGIEIGEELDKVLVLHEIAHGWANHDGMDERWMIEGMAEYAGRTAAGDTEPAADPSFDGPLVDWGPPDLSDTDDEAVEQGGYNTAHYVVATIFSQIGADRFDDVFAAVTSASGDRAQLEDWQTFLDAAEPIIGTDATDSTFVSDLFTARVTDKAGNGLIGRRTATRRNFDGLVDAARQWPTPTTIEDSVGRWEFDEADEVIARATTTLGHRDALELAAQQADLEVGIEQFTTPFGNAAADADFTAIDSGLAKLDVTVDEVVEARTTVESSNGFFESVGSWWRDDPAEHLDTATRALADGDAPTASAEAARADELASTERRTGVVRVAVAITVLSVLLLLVLMMVIWQLRRRRRTVATLSPDNDTSIDNVDDNGTVDDTVDVDTGTSAGTAIEPTGAAPVRANPPLPSPPPLAPSMSGPFASAPSTATADSPSPIPANVGTPPRTPPPPHAVRIPARPSPPTNTQPAAPTRQGLADPSLVIDQTTSGPPTPLSRAPVAAPAPPEFGVAAPAQLPTIASFPMPKMSEATSLDGVDDGHGVANATISDDRNPAIGDANTRTDAPVDTTTKTADNDPVDVDEITATDQTDPASVEPDIAVVDPHGGTADALPADSADVSDAANADSAKS